MLETEMEPAIACYRVWDDQGEGSSQMRSVFGFSQLVEWHKCRARTEQWQEVCLVLVEGAPAPRTVERSAALRHAKFWSAFPAKMCRE